MSSNRGKKNFSLAINTMEELNQRIDITLGIGNREKYSQSNLLQNIIVWALRNIPEHKFQSFCIDAVKVWEVYTGTHKQPVTMENQLLIPLPPPIKKETTPAFVWENFGGSNNNGYY